MRRFGGFSNAISYSDTGTMVNLQPRVYAGDAVIVDISVSSSDVSNRADGPAIGENPGGEPIRADQHSTLSFQTTTRIASGSTVLLGGVAGSTDRQVVLVSAKIVR